MYTGACVAEDSKLNWCQHTFNPWWGCTKVSPACDHCYAERMARRMGSAFFGHPVVWGPKARRGYQAPDHWQQPLRWNTKAERSGKRARVFCASMADVFEGLAEQRPRLNQLFDTIASTPHLDWMLLTKRPHNVLRLAPSYERWPPNLWIGCTVENAEWATKRLRHLLKVPAALRFVCAEPLLGPLDLSSQLGADAGKVNWIVCGGESGGRARGTDETLRWYRALRDQACAAGVPFYFRQWGRFQQRGEQVVALRRSNPDNRLDGAHWEQVPRLHR